MKKKDLGIGVSRILRLLPYSISSLPYDFAFRFVQSSFQDLDIELWSRNSHALKTLNPGASDLDITVYANNSSPEIINSFFKRFTQIKRYIPFLGEINWIDAGEIKNFVPFLNPYEADRDLELKTKFNYRTKKSQAYKICFFLRCLASDTYGIRTDYNSRKRKWNGHLEDLGFSAQRDSFVTPDAIFHFLEQKLLLENIPSYKEGFLGKLIQNYHQDINSWNRFYSSTEVRDFMILAPNRWLGATLHYQNMDQDLIMINKFTSLEKELFISHLEWEIWGLFTQYHQISDKPGLQSHLENFLKVCHALDEAPHLRYGFEKLIELQS